MFATCCAGQPQQMLDAYLVASMVGNPLRTELVDSRDVGFGHTEGIVDPASVRFDALLDRRPS